jgi:hypothetical protein
MSTSDQPSEEELRAAYEAELKKIRVEQIVLEQIVSLVNLGMRRTGLAPGTEDERDPPQVRVAIEAVRALLPLVEQSAPAQVNAIRDALSQLQLAYVRIGGPAEAGAAAPTGEPAAPPPPSGPESAPPGGSGSRPEGPAPGASPESEPPKPGEPGPAQRSGRLWIPGQ